MNIIINILIKKNLFVKMKRKKKFKLFVLLLKVTRGNKFNSIFSLSLSQGEKKCEENFYTDIYKLIKINVSVDCHPITFLLAGEKSFVP